MVHVKDVVEAILHFTKQALAGTDRGVRVCNLGGSERVNRYELAVKIANKLQLDGSCVKGVDRPMDGGGVPSPPDISMNVDKLTKELGVEKLDGLNEIIMSTFN
jgi:dTDP-4-dehydrorhamnose reductase